MCCRNFLRFMSVTTDNSNFILYTNIYTLYINILYIIILIYYTLMLRIMIFSQVK